ncbi:NADH-quinone oxidoreductase subunit A [Buchnera aphidicola]|uniref:NADH-quinone oxidoreductase subunit A n=1 Tax=Buchnera aphidicola TaxID=9 RepID=UPI003D18AA8C
MCFLMLFGGWLLGQRTVSRSKNIPFESGVISYGNINLNFAIKFYLLSIFFVIFDIESLYLYTWSIDVRNIGWIGFFEVVFFVFLLFLSLMYLIQEKVFQWVPKKSGCTFNF